MSAKCRYATARLCAAALASASAVAHADHEAAFYPSFYPQEIRIETIDAAAAAGGWPKARVHAQVDDDLFAGQAPPKDASAVSSLRAIVTLTFDASPGRTPPRGDKARCEMARHVARSLAANVPGFVRYPYPVTPWHGDYLEQFDLARKAEASYDRTRIDPSNDRDIRVRTIGALAQALLPAPLEADASGWDATLESVDVDRLGATEASLWLAAPWVRQGWYQAWQLFKDHVHGDAASRSSALYRRLVSGDYASALERIDLSRALVGTLAATCERAVVGYALRREYFNAEYSNGVEDVAFDAQSGLASRIFPRSVKLKDFPWNGWLRIGTAGVAGDAWNPVGGMGDDFGRLVWYSTSDAALLPNPYGGGWIDNRASVEALRSGAAIPIPQDALRPETGSGRVREVGAGKKAREVLRYLVVTSKFHDGSSMSEADILYPYMFAYRWSDRTAKGETFEPLVAQSTALMREWLAGFKLAARRTKTRNYGDDLKFSYPVFVVDVYLARRLEDRSEAAAVAPPWSTLPWNVLVLMEEAVQRGIAAFSHEEAQRRGVPWLDLVRDRETGERLNRLVERFRDEGYRPAALASLVSASEARERWSALAAYYAQHGHFLVTNGPYRLDSWRENTAVLTVFRDASYPQGVGTFDDYAIPRKAYVAKVEDLGDRIEVSADAEMVSRFQRSYELERHPVSAAAPGDDPEHRPECRYLVIRADGKVARAGVAPFGRDGHFIVDLRGLAGPGAYSVAIAMLVPPNGVDPDVRLVTHVVPGTGVRPAPATSAWSARPDAKARQNSAAWLSMPAAQITPPR